MPTQKAPLHTLKPEPPVSHRSQALLLLARRHTALLARFGAFLASILDHLECFSDEQLRKVFEMFAALTSPAGEHAAVIPPHRLRRSMGLQRDPQGTC